VDTIALASGDFIISCTKERFDLNFRFFLLPTLFIVVAETQTTAGQLFGMSSSNRF
jgi:hypothetical protein